MNYASYYFEDYYFIILFILMLAYVLHCYLHQD